MRFKAMPGGGQEANVLRTYKLLPHGVIPRKLARCLYQKVIQIHNGHQASHKILDTFGIQASELLQLVLHDPGHGFLHECEYVSHLYDRVVYYLMREIEILNPSEHNLSGFYRSRLLPCSGNLS